MSTRNGDTDMQDTATTVTNLPTNRLRPNDYNPNRMTKAELDELVEEVRHLGRLPKPVVVRPSENGYMIIDGEHSWRAAAEVGLKDIPCEVVDADDFEAMRQTYKRNQHGTHDRIALGRMFRFMLEDRDLSKRGLAQELKVSEGTVRNALLFAEAADLRSGYAQGHGGNWSPESDWWFKDMTVRQARLYVVLPELGRDRWLGAGCPDYWGFPEGVAWEQQDDLVYYFKELVGTGIAKVFERGAWGDSAKAAYDLLEWREKYRRILGDGVDAYIRTVVDLHSKSPTPVQILERLPIHDGKPFLTSGEWDRALRVAWEKGGSVGGVLSRISDIAKLRAGESGVPTDDLEDPRVALMKFEVEQDAPDFVRAAEIPLRDKHFLTYSAPAGRLTDEDLPALKREVVERLEGEHRRYGEQRAEFERWMSKASLEDLARAMAGAGPRYPKGTATAKGVWDHHVSRWWEKKRVEAERALLDDTDKLVERAVGKLREAAPKTFEKEEGGEPAWRILDRRLRAMPRPELVLMAAVLLRTPVTAWLEAVGEEGHPEKAGVA
ncbi:MAG: ParB N-terminal domain-containing protein [Rubrobacteraceae bacterium]|nr:ParB N-terminal domain-containing protein [Rubrobacteraceae bacterium]